MDMINKSINNVYISINEAKAYISLAIFYSKRMQDMNISIALATPPMLLAFSPKKATSTNTSKNG
jgi:hypothetical protein